MDIKLQQLKNFLTIYKAGGYRAATKDANRSQAALSTSIKELEKQLNNQLFQDGPKAKLTPFGKTCLKPVQQFIDHYDYLNEFLYSASHGQEGKLSIASIPSIATKLLPALIAEFAANYPKIKISLLDDNALGVISRVCSAEVDLAFGSVSTYQPNIHFTPLLSDPVGVVCLQNHPLNQKKGVHWQDIKAYPFIENGTCSLLKSTKAQKLLASARYQVANISSLLSLLELGFGVTTLPKMALPEKNKKLAWVPLINPDLKREIGIIRRSDPYHCAQADSFSLLSIEYFKKIGLYQPKKNRV